MKIKKKKQKKIKSKSKKADYTKAWKIYIEREGIFLNALLRKKDLEQKLSLVRIEIIDMCIDTTRRNIVCSNKKLTDVTYPKNIKIAKRKRTINK